MGVLMSELPYWIQSIQALGPTVVAVIVAGIAGYIAWRQWRTAHDRLSFDLFEKRFAVYEATRNFLIGAILHGQVRSEDYVALYNGISGTEFLFSGETRSYVMNIRDKAYRAQAIRSGLAREPNHPRADKLIDEEETILQFFLEQDDLLESKFKPYLDLSNVGLTSH
jgi:hypothetical protein